MDVCGDFVKEAEEALKKSMFGKPNPELACRKYEGAALCYRKNEDPKSALQYYSIAAKMRLDLGDLGKAASHFWEMGSIAKKLRTPYQEFFLDAAGTYKKIADDMASVNPLKSSELYSKIAECFIEADKHEQAAQIYIDSSEIALKKDNYVRAIVNLAGAMNCYESMNDYKRACDISKKISEIWLSQGVFEKAMEAFGKTGFFLEKIGDLPQALDFYLKAVEAAKKHGNRRFLARSHESVGKTHLALQNKKKAGYHFFLAAEEYASVSAKPNALEDYQKAADVYIEGNARKNAVTCILKIAQIQKGENNLTAAEAGYLKSAELLEAEGEMEAAEIVLKQRADMWEDIADYLNSARAYEDMANFCERNNMDAHRFFEKAAEYHFLNAEKLAKIKNLVLSKKEYMDAGLCFEKIENLDRALECFRRSGNVGEYNRLTRVTGLYENRKREEIERRLSLLAAEQEEIEIDRRTNVLSEEDFLIIKKIYTSLKTRLEQKLKE